MSHHVSALITGLDHPAIAVRDLDVAAETWERLGFALTPTGEHPEWGTTNQCVMFAHDYIELLAPTGAGDEAETLRAFTAQREGLYSLSFSSPNGAAVADALGRSGLTVPVPRSLSRRLTDDAGTTLMFSQIPLPADATPGIKTRIVQHITAERIRHPHWLSHPNGAVGLASVSAILEDPVSQTPFWDRLFGPHMSVITDQTVTVHTGRGLVFLCHPEDLTQLHPDAELDELPSAPALVALAIKVRDTTLAAAILKTNGVIFSRDSEGTLRIPPSEAQGVFIEMIEA